MTLNEEEPTFYSLMWEFGDYLVRTLKDQQEFLFDECINRFLNTFAFKVNQKVKSNLKKKLFQVCKLFNQNSICILPDQLPSHKKKPKNPHLKNISPIYDHFKNNFVLNPIWRSVLLKKKPSLTTTNTNMVDVIPTVCNTENNQNDLVAKSSRSEKTIGLLTFQICKMLSKGPFTREELTKETGFIKQRISTVLAIYKSINLVSEDKSTHHIFWNGYQANVISNSKKYSEHLIKLRNQKRFLAKKLSRMLHKFESKLPNDHFDKKPLATVTKNSFCDSLTNHLHQVQDCVVPFSEEKVSQMLFSENVHSQNCITQQALSSLESTKKIILFLKNLKAPYETNLKQLCSSLPKTQNTKKNRKKLSSKKSKPDHRKSIKLRVKKAKKQPKIIHKKRQSKNAHTLSPSSTTTRGCKNQNKISPIEQEAIKAILSLTNPNSFNTHPKKNSSFESKTIKGNTFQSPLSRIPLLLLITQEN
ncbi:hypothetical protein M0812_00313 [Anaeramoeba flamelloides]|uniref:Uncharacterized protein n=1 Tax=Anaeramoeba flamelloides TaxID=1746091 RepID=A0AAV8A534_9EUKA|nr:hypothetical protein M0812_00313 [Anaeramoeba flamelloides]